MIKIIVSEQLLYHRRKSGVVYTYPVSTAKNGVGNGQGSFKTPLGRHRIHEKIGKGIPEYTAFAGRKPIGVFSTDVEHQRSDWILSRILWLDGTQTGVNKRGRVDSRARYIYIHGTNEEFLIGQPASHGCIRMCNADVIDLFEHVSCGETVLIKP